MFPVKVEVTVGTREASEMHRLTSLTNVHLSELLSSVLEGVLIKRVSDRQTSFPKDRGRADLR